MERKIIIDVKEELNPSLECILHYDGEGWKCVKKADFLLPIEEEIHSLKESVRDLEDEVADLREKLAKTAAAVKENL